MQVQDLNPNAFADLFPAPADGNQKQGPLRFGMEETFQDILNVDETTDNQPDNTSLVKNEVDELIEKDVKEVTEESNNTDLTNIPDTKKVEEKKAEEIKGLSDYFSQKMQEGKFVAINEEDDKGNKVPFIPKTIEDFDEVMEIQMNFQRQQAQREMEQKWYESKSPAWKAVAQYAEMVDDPSQLVPFLEGVKTIQSVGEIDENEIDGAEEIVRIRMEQRGDPEEVITSQIEALKTTDKLISTAKQYKPVIVNQEKQVLAQQVRQAELEKQAWAQEVNDIRTKAYQEIEKPFFGKSNLKRDEKAAIFNLIAQPSEETKGFAIYDEIDKLFAKRDFETLKQVALLVAKKDSFYNYVGIDTADKTANSLKRKLQAAVDSRSSSGNDYDEERIPSVTRTKTGPLRFGR